MVGRSSRGGNGGGRRLSGGVHLYSGGLLRSRVSALFVIILVSFELTGQPLQVKVKGVEGYDGFRSQNGPSLIHQSGSIVDHRRTSISGTTFSGKSV
jgi:hypothetical protein